MAVRAPIHAGTVRHSDLTCTPQLVITDEPSAIQNGGSGAQHVWLVVIACGRRWDVASADRDRHGEHSCVNIAALVRK